MLAVLIPAQELFCYPGEHLSIDVEPVFQVCLFTQELLQALSEPSTDLILLTEYDPADLTKTATYTIRQNFGKSHSVRADCKLVQHVSALLLEHFGINIPIILSKGIHAKTGEFVPLEKQWVSARYTQRALFRRWSCSGSLTVCERENIEIHSLCASYVSSAQIQKILVKFYDKQAIHRRYDFYDRHAVILVDTDQTVLNNSDSMLFMQTVLNVQLIEVLKHFVRIFDSNRFDVRAIAMTARNKHDELVTWSQEPRPPTALPEVVASATKLGLSMELDQSLAFSNPVERTPEKKQLKLEFMLDLVKRSKFVVRRGSVFLLVDDCPLETHSTRARVAATRLAEYDCSVFILPVQHFGFVESVSTLPSLFAARGAQVKRIQPETGLDGSQFKLSV